jgi:hypothetical protein
VKFTGHVNYEAPRKYVVLIVKAGKQYLIFCVYNKQYLILFKSMLKDIYPWRVSYVIYKFAIILNFLMDIFKVNIVDFSKLYIHLNCILVHI